MSKEQMSAGAAAEPRPRPVAVIDIGTTSIRMAVAEIGARGEVRPLEALSQAVNLGKDTFAMGSISKSTIEDCVRVLKSYQHILREYQIDDREQIRVVATSAVREATNALAFLDRVYIATGIEIEPIDEAEVNRITYMGIRPYLQAYPQLASADTIVTEVGGGNTELLLVRKGNVAFSHTYRLGSLRLRKTLEAYRAPTASVRNIMASQIQRTVQQMVEHLPPSDQFEMIALGGDIRFAAAQLVPGWDERSLVRLSVDALDGLATSLFHLSEDQVVQKYRLSFQEAGTIGPALLAYTQLARGFRLQHLQVTDTNLRDGLLKEMAAQEAWTKEFRNQIVRSAITLGRRFEFDEPHAKQVALMCQLLFTQLQAEHQLDWRHEVVLFVAALLHEIGMFINIRSHHKHTMYLINNSEIFGLGKTELKLVALVARYHRRASPQPKHEGFAVLDRESRTAVAKLAAILRLGVALCASRSQRIRELRCQRQNGRLIIGVPQADDLTLEQLALRQSGSLFEEVFGMSVLLRALK